MLDDEVIKLVSQFGVETKQRLACVKWPQTRDDRKPRRKPVDGDPAQLDIPEGP